MLLYKKGSTPIGVPDTKKEQGQKNTKNDWKWNNKGKKDGDRRVWVRALKREH